jgi:hypothetical protein
MASAVQHRLSTKGRIALKRCSSTKLSIALTHQHNKGNRHLSVGDGENRRERGLQVTQSKTTVNGFLLFQTLDFTLVACFILS